MPETNMMGLKRSEVLKIEAAVVEILENAIIDVKENVEVNHGSEPDSLQMTFQMDGTSLSELNKIQGDFGENFSIAINPKDKMHINVRIEAPVSDYLKLLGKKS